MPSPSLFLVPTNPKQLPESQHLTNSKGSAGVTTWMALVIDAGRSFGLALKEFETGIYHDPEYPDIHAVFLPPPYRPQQPAGQPTTLLANHTPVPTPRSTNLGRDLDEELPEENTATVNPAITVPTRPTTPPPDPYQVHPVYKFPKYEKDRKTGELTANGLIAYRKACEVFEESITGMNNLRLALFTFLLANMTKSSTDALKLNATYIQASEDQDVVQLRTAINETHSQASLMLSLATFNSVTSAKQGSETLTAFFTKVAVLIGALSAAFASPSNPDFISIKSLHIATIFAGINAAHFQAYLDKLSLDSSLTHMDDLTVQQVTAALTTHDNNRMARESNAKTHNPPNQDMSLQQAQKLVTEHKLKQQQLQQQTNTGNALINTSPAPKNNSNNDKGRSPAWSEDHPHSHPRRPTPGPGNITQPHCPHCAKNNFIHNFHGHGDLKPCSDLPTSPQATAQAALMTNLLALVNGTASQHQQDSMAAFMDASVFDASALAAMNSGLGASVADADADAEARRAVSAAGGGAPKN